MVLLSSRHTLSTIIKTSTILRKGVWLRGLKRRGQRGSEWVWLALALVSYHRAAKSTPKSVPTQSNPAKHT
jgi:hypothetical protein